MRIFLTLAWLASAAGPLPIGDGAQRLVVGALRQAQREWDPQACFAGVRLRAHIKYQPVGPGARPGRLSSFLFFFTAPDKPNWHQIKWSEISGGEVPYDPIDHIEQTLDKYSPGFPYGNELGAVCVTEMTTDSDEALGIAIRAGLAPISETGYDLKLLLVQKNAGDYAKLKKWAGKTVWLVSESSGEVTVVIDAATGKVLKKGTTRELPRI